jgi:hypothetical protein
MWGTPSHSEVSSLSLCLRRLTDTIPLGGVSARDLYFSDPDNLNVFFSFIIPTMFSYRQPRDRSMAITKEILAHGTGEWVKRHFWTKWAGKQKFDSICSRFNGNLP